MDDRAAENALPSVRWEGPWNWEQVLRGQRTELCAALAEVLPRRRWFGSKSRAIRAVSIVDWLDFGQRYCTLIVRVEFAAGADELYQVPLAYEASDAPAAKGQAALVRVSTADGQAAGLLADALADPEFCERLLALFDGKSVAAADHGELVARPTAEYARLRGEQATLEPRLAGAEQSNTSVIFGQRLILKVFRRVEQGLNPDFELSAALTRHGFAHTPPLAGSLVYRKPGAGDWGLALLQAFVPNQGDAWSFTLRWLEGALPLEAITQEIPEAPARLVPASELELPTAVREAFGGFLARVELLGRRTAEMHLALAGVIDDADFRPQPFTADDGAQFFARARQQAAETFALLGEHLDDLSGEMQAQARRVVELERAALARYAALADAELRVETIRIHGDYHLGQVLATEDDFSIIDFEGEPSRSIAERRRKQLALRDVAGMIRSLHYASCAAAVAARGRTKSPQSAERWARSWYAWSSVAFLSAYRRTAGAAAFLPADPTAFEHVLETCLLEKAVYELRYELNNRPDWVYLPLAALEGLLG